MDTVTKVKELLNSVKRDGMKELIQYIQDETDFFTAPASSKFHGNYSMGLVEHSYHVYTLYGEKVERFKLDVPVESIIICGILHDLCKVNTYTPNYLKNGQLSDFAPYKRNDMFNIGHAEKSIIMIQRYMQLTKKEIVIIRMHMGAFEYGWKYLDEALKGNYNEYIAFHTSDFEASRYLDSERSGKKVEGVVAIKKDGGDKK